MENAERKANFENEKMKELLSQGSDPGEPVSKEVLKNIRHHLIHFFVGYRSKGNEEFLRLLRRARFRGCKGDSWTGVLTCSC